jgi:hypothetical protein
MRHLVVVLSLVFCASSFAFGQTASNESWKIIFSNSKAKTTQEWEQKLHVGGIRIGCQLDPAQCIQYASKFGEGGRKVFLNIVLKPESPSEAQEYSRLSPKLPFLQAITVDDFVRHYTRMSESSQAEAVKSLGGVVDNLKSANANLKFGVTLYEAELSSATLKEDKMPGRIRSKIDYVHLYLRYRANGQNYESYVQQAKSVFPNARIIAGAYAYDRIDYFPCAPGTKRSCTKDEEIKLFMQALTTQVRLLKSQAVEWIEFYPGAFGHEEEWEGWENSRICGEKRTRACADNTKEMRQAAAALLLKELGKQ